MDNPSKIIYFVFLIALVVQLCLVINVYSFHDLMQEAVIVWVKPSLISPAYAGRDLEIKAHLSVHPTHFFVDPITH